MGTTSTATRSAATRSRVNTSLAEAKLDARIRPDITVLRSVSSYPRRHRPVLELLPGGMEGGEAGGAAGAVVVPIRTTPTSPGPIRLTRRGKVVVSALGAVAVAALAVLIWFGVAGRAQAAAHLQPGPGGGHAMLR